MGCGPGCACHCCAGIAAETPLRPGNPPGLPQIAYRAGSHASFMETLVTRLSSGAFPALAALTTREPEDATLAVLDALASSLDVLTFYSERYANENYLRTATERLSVIELARLIGYRPAPGVAASTHLAFTMQDLPGAGAEGITIPVGTRVQSVPGQDEVAQTFETVAPAPARAAWNRIPVRRDLWRVPAAGDRTLWLQGITTGLEPGDAILIVGTEREADPTSTRWQVRVLNAVTPENDRDRTRVAWADPLTTDAPAVGVEIHAFRQRASLFGSAAPDPNLFSPDSNIIEKIDQNILVPELAENLLALSFGQIWSWKGFSIGSTIDLEPQNPKLVAGGWVALVSNGAGGTADLPGQVGLFRAGQVAQITREDFALSSKISRITPDTTSGLNQFGLRATRAFAQSEPLEPAPIPLRHPVHGDRLTLGHRVEGLLPGQPLALTGKRQPIFVARGATGLELRLDAGGELALAEGDRLFMLEPAAKVVVNLPFLGHHAPIHFEALSALEFTAALELAGIGLRLRLMDRDGRTGVLFATSARVELGKAAKDDPVIREIAFIAGGGDAVEMGRDLTGLKLSASLTHVYERASLTVNANVAAATHGETVEAILGDGDGRRANQRFALNQQPLTHTSAPTPSGRASTLELRVNDVLWSERASLFAAPSDARVYEMFETDDGRTVVQFGDGIEGARLPSGVTNLRARYRKGLGAGGNVAAGKLTTLLSRPLGLTEVINPDPATGGEDAEPLDRARENAPLTVLTLDRAVSVADYRDFARAFAGIDKAHALWIPWGVARGVFLTIAGVNGATVPENGAAYGDLARALATYGDPLMPIRIVNHTAARFRIRAAVKVLAGHLPDKVIAAVEAALRAAFAFSARGFGQTVSLDEVAAIAQRVEGVEAVHVSQLYRAGETPSRMPRIFARLPVASLGQIPDAAELLTLADDPLAIEVMP